MLLKPQKIMGMSFKNSRSTIMSRKKGIFFLLSFNSLINLFNLNTLLIKAKSPFLHHKAKISSIISIKNRTIVVLNNSIQILDFLIPTTRFIFNGDKIEFFFKTGKNIFIFLKFSKKIVLFDPWKLKILTQTKIQKNIIHIQIEKYKKNQNLIMILTSDYDLEILNKKKDQFTNNFLLKSSFPILSFKYIYIYDIIVIGSYGKILIYDFTKKKKILQLNFRKSEKIYNILFSFSIKNYIFIQKKKKVFSYDIFKKTFKKLKINCHEGKYFIEQFIENSNLFMTLGTYDKNIILHKFCFKKKDILSLKIRIGNKYPIEKIENNLDLKNFVIYTDIKGKIYILETNYLGNILDINLNIHRTKKKEILTSKKRKKALKICQFKSKCFFSNEIEFWIVICFYKKFNPFIWKIKKKISNQLNVNITFGNKQLSKTSTICLTRNLEFIIIGYENNSICLFNIARKKLQNAGKNHKIKKIKQNCRINVLSCDKYNQFFISGCNCGLLFLWQVSIFKKIKLLNLKKIINLSKWCQKFDIILVATIDYEIKIVFPETFSIIRTCNGHNDQITDFLLIKKSKFLLSSSRDKTVKIWNLFNNHCQATVNFRQHLTAIITDHSENLLFSYHHNTIGIGLTEICEKDLVYNFASIYIKSLERNGKILNFQVFFLNNLNFLARKYNKEKNIRKNDDNFKLFLIYQKYYKSFSDSDFFFIHNFNFFNFEYNLIKNNNFMLNLFQSIINQNISTNFNSIFFLIELFLDKIICKMNFEISINFFHYTYKIMYRISNLEKILKSIFTRILLETKRQDINNSKKFRMD